MNLDPAYRPRPTPDDPPDWVRAIEMGIDVSLLEENLRLTPAQRIRQLEAMDEFFVAVHSAAWRR